MGEALGSERFLGILFSHPAEEILRSVFTDLGPGVGGGCTGKRPGFSPSQGSAHCLPSTVPLKPYAAPGSPWQMVKADFLGRPGILIQRPRCGLRAQGGSSKAQNSLPSRGHLTTPGKTPSGLVSCPSWSAQTILEAS